MFSAQLVSSIGSQVTLVALFYQVYELTESPLMTGLLGLASSSLGNLFSGRR